MDILNCQIPTTSPPAATLGGVGRVIDTCIRFTEEDDDDDEEYDDTQIVKSCMSGFSRGKLEAGI